MNTLMIGIDMLGEILSAFIIGLIITGLAASDVCKRQSIY